MPIEIAHLTIDGKEIDEKPIKNNEVTTKEAIDVVNMFNANKPMFIKFYANWCGHCVSMDGDWKNLVKEMKVKHPNADIALVAVESKVIDKYIDQIISGTKGLGKVEGFPTIGLIQHKKFTSYNGERKKDAMLSYLEDNVINKKMKGGKTTKLSKTMKRRKTTKRTKRRKITKRCKTTKRMKRRRT
jgi:thiol-disulfide isomerase/thioredoxin